MSGPAPYRARCAACNFFVPNPREKTPMEEYEADARPEASGLIGMLRWFWNPNAFRMSPPGGDVDDVITNMVETRNQSGRCVRFPKSHQVNRAYGCGEFTADQRPNKDPQP